MTFLRNFFTGISNLWYFRKVIWNFRWWDYQYNLEVFAKTWECTRDGILKKGIHLCKSEDIIQIQELLDELKRFNEQPFIEEAEQKIGYKLIGFDFEDIPGTELSQLVDKPGKDKEKTNQVLDLAHKLEEENWEKIWKLCKENMRGWWD